MHANRNKKAVKRVEKGMMNIQRNGTHSDAKFPLRQWDEEKYFLF